MLKTFHACCVLGCLIATASSVRADEPRDSDKPASRDSGSPERLYDLKYKFRTGEVVRSEVVHRATVQTSIQGTSQTAETRTRSVKAWKITGVSPSGHVRFVHSVESIDMWQRTKGRQELHYNSQTDKTVPPGYEDVAKAVGVPLTVVTIDQRGKIISREDMHQQAPGGGTPITIPLPTKPVPLGHVWSSPQEVEVLLKGGLTKKVSTRQKYTLRDVQDGIATIEVDTQVLTPMNDPAIEAQLVQRLTAGTMRFDIKLGRVVGQQMDLDRRVIGFSGPSSSMHYLMRFTEEIAAGDAQTAERESEPAVSQRVRRARANIRR